MYSGTAWYCYALSLYCSSSPGFEPMPRLGIAYDMTGGRGEFGPGGIFVAVGIHHLKFIPKIKIF